MVGNISTYGAETETLKAAMIAAQPRPTTGPGIDVATLTSVVSYPCSPDTCYVATHTGSVE